MTGYSLKEISTRLNTGQIPQVTAGAGVYTKAESDATLALKPNSSDLVGAIGNINSPLLDMPLKNSLAMKAGVGSATFTRASTATYIDRYGVLKSAAIDEPRFEKEGYLNEGSSTNLLTYSEQFDNAVWSKTGTTIVANTTEVLDPYGTNLADKLTNSGGTTSLIWENITVPSSLTTSYAASVFCKAGSLTRITLNPYYPGEAEYNIHFEFSTKTFTGIPAGGSASYTELANGWFRLVVVMPYSTTGATTLSYRIWPDRLITTIGGYNYIFGAQLEALPFATSYIPTVASTVTRSADVLSVTANGNVGLHKSEITMMTDFDIFGWKPTEYPKTLFIIKDTASIQLLTGNAGAAQSYAYKYPSGSAAYNITANTKYRHCASFNATNGSFYVNGVLIESKAYASSQSKLDFIYIGSQYGTTHHHYGHISNVRIYDRVLTTQEVALA